MYDVIVIGGGIVGAATAYELCKYQLKTLILEAERRAFKKRTEPFARELRRSLCSHCGNRKSVGILPCFSRNCC